MLVRESLYNFKRESDPIASSGLGKIALIKNWLDKYEIKNYIINNNYTIDVNGDVIISNTNIYKLPDYINFNIIHGNFFCQNCKLISLIGCPTIVEGGFYCHSNNLTSLEGCPIKVNNEFFCSDNDKSFNINYVKSLCDVYGGIKV